MLQFDILSGNKAGTRIVARRFPFTIGRSQTDDLQLSEPGVWEKHFTIDLDRESRNFRVACVDNASLTINGEAVVDASLRNGDLLQVGGTRIRVGLTAPVQQSLALREMSMWLGLGVLCLVEVAIFYWLTQ